MVAKFRRLKEVWKDIPGYEGYYQVSNIGQVRSLDREIYNPTSGKYKLKGQEMKPDCNGGYAQFSLCKNGGIVKYLAHRLVLLAFVGPCPIGLECCHGDGDPKNNILQNLRWDTSTSNKADRKKHGTGNEGTKHWGCRLTKEDVLTIRNRYEAGGITQAELGGMYGVSQTHIGRLIRRVRWGHVQ